MQAIETNSLEVIISWQNLIVANVSNLGLIGKIIYPFRITFFEKINSFEFCIGILFSRNSLTGLFSNDAI